MLQIMADVMNVVIHLSVLLYWPSSPCRQQEDGQERARKLIRSESNVALVASAISMMQPVR